MNILEASLAALTSLHQFSAFLKDGVRVDAEDCLSRLVRHLEDGHRDYRVVCSDPDEYGSATYRTIIQEIAALSEAENTVQQDVDLAKPHVSDLNQIFEEAERENAADRMVGRKRIVGLSSDVPAIAANSTRQTNSVLKRRFANELDIALGENDQETPVKAALAALSYGNLVGANGSRLEVPAGTSLKTIDALTERDQDERVGGYSGPWVCKSLVIAYTYRISGGRWCAVSPIR